MSVSAVWAPNAVPVVAASTEPPATRAMPPLAPRDRKVARVLVSMAISSWSCADTACSRRPRRPVRSVEERGDRIRRLAERVPEHGVAARHGDDLEQVAERGAMRVEQVVVGDIRVRAED